MNFSRSNDLLSTKFVRGKIILRCSWIIANYSCYPFILLDREKTEKDKNPDLVFLQLGDDFTIESSFPYSVSHFKCSYEV